MAAPVRKVIYRRPWLYPKQKAAIFNDARTSVIEATTKGGKTFGCLAWIIEQAMRAKTGQDFWWVAPVSAQANIAFARLKRQLKKTAYRSREQEKRAIMPTGASIWFKSADHPDSLYGEDVYGAVVDEASRVKEEAWHAIRTTLVATRAPVRIIGNVKGRRNWFYKLARQAESGEPGMEHHRITAADAVKAGVLVAEEIEAARRGMPDDVAQQLFDAVAADDEGNPFGFAHITACLQPGLSRLPPVAWGWDLARKRDWTVGIAVDRDGNVCRFERWRKPWPETTREIRRLVGVVPTAIDETGVGDPIVQAAQAGRQNVEGYLYTAQSKQRLMEGLAQDIQAGDVGFPDGVIKTELDEFEYVYTRTGVIYSAPEGFWDDCVNALALACWRRRNLRHSGVSQGAMGGMA